MSGIHARLPGRSLLILDTQNLGNSDYSQRALRDSHSKMTAFQLPPPTIGPSMPSRLHFNTELRPSFSEPSRYETMSHLQKSTESARSTWREQLPSVSQLLTPASQSSVPHSPFSPPYSNESSAEHRSGHPSPGRNSTGLHPEQSGAYPSHDGYTPANMQSRHRETVPDVSRRGSAQVYPLSSQYPFPYSSRHDTSGPPYASYNEHSRSATYSQPVPFNSSNRYYQGQINNYGPASSPISVSGQNDRDFSTPTVHLPRVVGEQTIPGEGPCYIYEDGSRCKKIIDGEPVNAQWGVTKAGKPRKRLAIACMTCREKKIKCDPGDPKCIQCDKFGRECRFQTAPRGHHSSSVSPSYENQAHTPTSTSVKADLRTYSPSSEPQVIEQRHSFKRRSSSAEPRYDDHMRQTPYDSPIRGRPCLKRHQQSIPESQGAKVMKTRAHSQVAVDTPSVSSIRSWDGDLPTPDHLGFDWRKDPYSIDVPITDHYIELYFTHINGVTYPIFPRKPFLHWVRNEKKKSSDDLMLVYSILAVGSIFSLRPGRDEEGSQLARLAQHAVEKQRGTYTLQLAQSRILLSLYCLSTGDSEKAWDYCGLASRAAAGLKLNVESIVPEMDGYNTQVYGLTQHGLAECLRRTFWSIYLVERLNGHLFSHSCAIQDEDIFVRLPCKDESYEIQEDPRTASPDTGAFETNLSNPTDSSALSPMAYLVQLSSIWTDVLAHIHRSAHLSDTTYRTSFGTFHTTTTSRLSAFISNLPPHLSYNPFNTSAHAANNLLPIYITVHTLYHYIHLVLNRYTRLSLLSPSALTASILAATRHARSILRIMQSLTKIPTDLKSLPPFVATAIVTATDILSAAGSFETELFTDTLRIMNGGLSVVDEVARCWNNVKVERRKIKERIGEVAESGIGGPRGIRGWVVEEGLEGDSGIGRREMDLFYMKGEGRNVLLRALGVEGRVIILEYVGDRGERNGTDEEDEDERDEM